MTTPIWLLCGVFIGLFGYAVDPDRNIHSLIRAMLLGIVGSLQGMVIAVIFSAFPSMHIPFSSFYLSFFGALLLLTLGKITRWAF